MCVVAVVLWAVAVVAPRVADRMNLLVVLRIGLAHFLGSFLHAALHSFPLIFRDFHFFNLVRIEDVAIHNDRLHSRSTMGLERPIDTTDNAFFGVEGAVLAARTTTFLQCDN